MFKLKRALAGWLAAALLALAQAPAPPAPPQAHSRYQCAAQTRQGKRCKRRAQPGSRFCWQHDPQRPRNAPKR